MKSLILLLATCVMASCSPPKFPVSFHAEAEAVNSSKFTLADPKTGKMFDKAAFISQSGFESYYSFAADDGVSRGVVFNINPKMQNRVEAYTSQNIHKFILPVVNGNPMEAMQLDRPLKTRIYIAGGFSPADLKKLSEIVPPDKDHKAQEEAILKTAPHYKALLDQKIEEK